MAPTLPQISPARFRSWLFRLPLFTRIALLAIFLFWTLELWSYLDFLQWGALVPSRVNLGTSQSSSTQRESDRKFKGLTPGLLVVYRLNTYPLIHSGFLQAMLSAAALVPLLERFETEHGTILSGAFFFGRESNSGSATPTFFVSNVSMQRCRLFLPHYIFLSKEGSFAGTFHSMGRGTGN